MNETGILSNFTEICNRNLPFERQINILQDNSTECDLDLNKKIFWDSYDLDTSIGGFNFYVKNKTCEDMQKWKWVVDIDEVDNSFRISGTKLWWGVFILFTIPIVILIKKTIQLNKRIEKELKYE